MTTFTLTGTFTHQNSPATPISKSPIHVHADPFPLGSTVQTDRIDKVTDANGTVTFTLTTGVTGLYYVVRSTAKRPLFKPIRFLAPAAGTVLNINTLIFYNPGDPPVIDQIHASQAAVAALQSDAASSAAAAAASAALAHDISGISTPDGVVASFNRRRGSVYDIRDYGAVVDGVVLTDAAMTAGSKVLSTVHVFTSADVGKTIAVMGAGTIASTSNDGVYVSTIASVSGGVATLTANATTTCTGKRAVFGTPDDAAFASARDAAVTAGGGVVLIPAGHTIVTQGHAVASFVSYVGLGRELSWVHPIFLAPNGGTSIQTSWLTAVNYPNANNPLTGLTLADFGVEAEGMAMANGGAYTASLKPLNIWNVNRCTATRLYVRNTPATSIPFDESVDACEITFNVIRNPGRLAGGTQPGGSGIGMGILTNGTTEPTIVMGNSIFGLSATTAGQNGIFVEAQTGADYTNATTGYRIIGNYIENMHYGISDAGGRGTIITDNIIRGCVFGVSLRQTDIQGSFHGIDTLVSQNQILDCVTGEASGIRVQSFPSAAADSVNLPAPARTRIFNNLIDGSAFRGIALVVGKGFDPSAVAYGLDGIVVRGNRVRSCIASGIIADLGNGTANLSNLVIEQNDVTLCGTSLIAGDQSGITVTADVVHPTIKGNRTYQCAKGFELGAGFTLGAQASGGRVEENDFGSMVISGIIDPWVTFADNDILWSDPLTGSGALVGSAVGPSSKTWAAATGQTAGTAVLTRNSNGISVPSNADSIHVLFALFDTAKANQVSYIATAGASGGAVIGVVVRATDASNYWRLCPDSGNANKWTLQKTVAGTRTNVAAYSVQGGSDTVRVICSGNSLTVSINGVAQTSVTDSFNNTATLAGIFSSSSIASTVRLTNFNASAI